MKALFAALAMLAVTAPNAVALSATQTVLKEIQTTSPTGDVSTRYIEATLVVPGETIVYNIDYVNDRDEPVTDMVLTMPIPDVVLFQDGSADQDGMRSYFSTDGGETFQTREDLRVDTGDGNLAPAKTEDLTHVRWVSIDAVPVDAKGTLQFRAILK